MIIYLPADWEAFLQKLQHPELMHDVEALLYTRLIADKANVLEKMEQAKASEMMYEDFFLDTVRPLMNLTPTMDAYVRQQFKKTIVWISSSDPVKMSRVPEITRMFYELRIVPPRMKLTLNVDDIPDDSSMIPSWLTDHVQNSLEQLSEVTTDFTFDRYQQIRREVLAEINAIRRKHGQPSQGDNIQTIIEHIRNPSSI